jgi:hypothetical protein
MVALIPALVLILTPEDMPPLPRHILISFE